MNFNEKVDDGFSHSMPCSANVNKISLSLHILCIVPSSSNLFPKLLFLLFFSLQLYAMKQVAHFVFCFSSMNYSFLIIFIGTSQLQNLDQVMESVVKQLV